MTAKKVFVTGAAGQTGLATVKWLNQEGKNLDVWAGIRKGEPSQETTVKTMNVCPCVTEASDVNHLCECFRDVQDLFIVPSSTEDKVELACNYIDAAKRTNVKFVLLLSVLGAERTDYTWGQQFHRIEEHLKNSDLPSWCILRTPFYAQNLLLYKEQIKNGVLPLPTGEGRFPPCAVEDVGKIAARILTDCSPHKGKVYQFTGPETLNGKEMATMMTNVFNRTVEFKDISPEEARSILKTQNVPEVETKALLDFYRLAKQNVWAHTHAKDFEMVCNGQPMTLHQWLINNKSQFV